MSTNRLGDADAPVEGEAPLDVVSTEASVEPWRWTLAALAVASLGIVLVHLGTFRSIISIWGRSGTFAHGYLILPISLYLIWEDRARLRRLTPEPDARALVALAAMGAGWLVSRLAGVLVLEQYFAVSALAVGVWAVVGSRVGRAIAFPLGFLLFGVPIGEALIPPLIEFTASFTMAGLGLVGVAAIRTGNIIELSTGTWEVVEACSGLRYLIASVTIGVLFAHLTFRSWARKLVFILLAFIVPIFANGLRALGIVMIGHLSDMRYAIGIDHLIYGWLFFGVVIFLLLWAGSLFRDDAEPLEAGDVDEHRATVATPGHRLRRLMPTVVLVVLVASLAPGWAGWAESRASAAVPEALEFELPGVAGAWAPTHARADWQPRFVGAQIDASGFYARGGDWVSLHVAYYAEQRQGSELVNSSNGLVTRGKERYSLISRSSHVVAIADQRLGVVEGHLASPDRQLLAWSWFWIDGAWTTNRYRAKAQEAIYALMGKPLGAGAVTVYTQHRGDPADARARLDSFAASVLPEIDARLRSLSDGGDASE